MSDMLEKLQHQLDSKFSFLRDKQLFVAVSGGIDSVVLLDAMQKLKYDIAALHCNFSLRGFESDADQQFVESYCRERDIQCLTEVYDTQAFADEFKLSIQMAARRLRYEWFSQMLQQHNFDFVLTGHNADDNLETFVINLSRGTGIDGLLGIPQSNNKIVRPLLSFSREEIKAYAQIHAVSWREDSSNSSEKYLRNKIRKKIVPELKQLNSNILASLRTTQDFLSQTNEMADDAAVLVYKEVAQYANDEIHFNLQKLTKLPNYKSYLYRWLRDYNFEAWDDIYDLVSAQTGKQVLAPQHRLLKNRHFFILAPIRELVKSRFEIQSGQSEVNIPLKLRIGVANSMSNVSDRVIFVDAEKIVFPLEIRKWEHGDVFYPFGMGGRSKKISKYFKDEKLSINEKQDAWLLTSNNKVMWIIGVRADDRFKITAETKQILKLELK